MCLSASYFPSITVLAAFVSIRILVVFGVNFVIFEMICLKVSIHLINVNVLTRKAGIPPDVTQLKSDIHLPISQSQNELNLRMSSL